MSGELQVVGFDPSLRNWGVAQGQYNPENGSLVILNLDVIQPTPPKGKQIRQNSKDLECASQLFDGAMEMAKGAAAVFVEVPHGSQSARAMASYGICVGILGSLRAAGIPFFELTALEVKMATVGKKNASKDAVINWGIDTHPEANWPIYMKEGMECLSMAKAEHMADAIGAIHAGIKTPTFQQLVAMRAAG
jgi:Holliday junction resolvasome RuvABC endonuclease subunit